MLQHSLDPIISHTLDICFDKIMQNKFEREVKMLGWAVYNSKFPPSIHDHGFRNWWGGERNNSNVYYNQRCNLMSFQELREQYELEKTDFFPPSTCSSENNF